MRENEPVLLVLSACDGKLFLRMAKFYLRNDMSLIGGEICTIILVMSYLKTATKIGLHKPA